MKKIFNVSNILSLLRMVLVIPIALFLLNEDKTMRYWAVGVGLIAVLTDRLDGYFARRYKEITDLGKILDPLADKIVVGVVVVILTLQNIVPIWFMAAIIARDLVILLGGLYMKKSINIIPQSNYAGKFAIVSISIVLILAILDINSFHFIKEIFIWITIFLLALSLFFYIKYFLVLVVRKDN